VRLDGDEMAPDADNGDAGHFSRTYMELRVLELHPIKHVDIFGAYRSLVVARGGTDTFDSEVINPAPLIRTRKPGLVVTDCKGNGLGVAEPCHHLVGVGVTGEVEDRDVEHVWPRQLVSEQSNLHLSYESYGTRRLRIAAGGRRSGTGVACMGA
jgi:hypothetical protein